MCEATKIWAEKANRNLIKEEDDDETVIMMALQIAIMHYRERNERRQRQCTE